MANKLISDEKAEWANQFNFSGVMRGTPFIPNAAITQKYERELIRLSEEMAKQSRRQIVKFFQSETATEFFGMDDTIASQSRILVKKMRERFSKIFMIESTKLSERMVRRTVKATGTGVQASLRELSGGLTIPVSSITPHMTEIIKAAVAQNVTLIRSIPERYFDDIEGAVMRSITTGRGLQDLVPALLRHEGVTIRQARTIARDQTKKTYAALSRERAIDAGIEEFEWVHTGGGKEPRRLHKFDLNGKIFRYDDPPVIDERTGERGYPGDAINCYCIARPIVRFNSGKQKE